MTKTIPRSYLPENYAANYSGRNYHPELAYSLALLAGGAYQMGDTKDNLEAMGFDVDDKEKVYFNPLYSMTWEEEKSHPDAVGYSISIKEMNNGNDLVLIIIRGTFGNVETVLQGNSEWLSDANILEQEFWGSGRHTGFSKAEQELLATLKDKLGGSIRTNNVRYVVTGHSRGSGIANLLEKDLLDAGVEKSKLFAYNFACPDVAKTYQTNFTLAKYDNIFNYGNAGDPVTLIPGQLGNAINHMIPANVENDIQVWGKYGQSRWFSEDWNNFFLNPDLHQPKYYVELTEKLGAFDQGKTWAQMYEQLAISLVNKRIESEVNTVVSIGKGAYNLWQDAVNEVGDIMSIAIHCPVDVVITDADGTELAATHGEEVTYNNDTDIKVLVHTEDDEKFFTVLGSGEMNITFTGTDAGAMDAEIMLNGNQFETETLLVYRDVPLTDGGLMTMHFSEDRSDYGNKISVLDSAGTVSGTVQPTVEAAPMVYGDLNLDHDLTVSDAVLMSRFLAEDQPLVSADALPLCDMDKDGVCSIMDTEILLRLLQCKVTE